MEYIVGLLLAAAVAGFAALAGFDCERAFYPTVVIVVASYYILFAVMGASERTLIAEIAATCVFAALAVLGSRRWPWLIAVALVGHGIFDSVHHLLIANPGVPKWWPGFCMAFDVALGALLALRLLRRTPLA
jgi:hypothetical protein